jgi:hypothetical protein
MEFSACCFLCFIVSPAVVDSIVRFHEAVAEMDDTFVNNGDYCDDNGPYTSW